MRSLCYAPQDAIRRLRSFAGIAARAAPFPISAAYWRSVMSWYTFVALVVLAAVIAAVLIALLLEWRN